MHFPVKKKKQRTNGPVNAHLRPEIYTNQRTIGPENAHLKPDLGVFSHNEMTLTLNTHTPLLTSQMSASAKFQVSGCTSFQTQ